MLNLMILENNRNLRNTFKRIFQKKVAGLNITESQSFIDAHNLVLETPPDIILTNTHIAGRSVLSFVNLIIEQYPNTHIIIVSEYNLIKYKLFEQNIKKGVVVFLSELDLEQIISQTKLISKSKEHKAEKALGKKKEKKTEREFEKKELIPISVRKENKVSFLSSLTHSLTHYIHASKVNVSE